MKQLSFEWCTSMNNYIDFLKNKQITAQSSGFDVDVNNLNSGLFDWQRDVVRWALKKGRCALFEDCGLGKTIQQLVWCEQVCNHTKMPILIIAPLAVTMQTKAEGDKFGISVNICRTQEDVVPGINITNYEMIEHFDASAFSGVVLDESSILKHQSSKTRARLQDMFVNTPYKLCATATPAPNDYMELGNHSEFLGVMSHSEMLATFFVHDGADTQKWRLKGHARTVFFEWISSWACCMNTPEDLGYDGALYTIPDLEVIEHEIESKIIEKDDGQLALMSPVAQTLNERRRGRRDSLEDRCRLAADIANSTDDQYIIWCDLNSESALLSELIWDSVEVKGSDTSEHKTKSMIGFADKNVRALVSKPSIAGWGMNWQNCNNVIFVGLSDSFESYYQAIRRCWRFGQERPVKAHIIISEAEGAVKANIERKQKDAKNMTDELIKFTKDILAADIRSTTRITETYYATNRMEVPTWLISA